MSKPDRRLSRFRSWCSYTRNWRAGRSDQVAHKSLVRQSTRAERQITKMLLKEMKK